MSGMVLSESEVAIIKKMAEVEVAPEPGEVLECKTVVVPIFCRGDFYAALPTVDWPKDGRHLKRDEALAKFKKMGLIGE